MAKKSRPRNPAELLHRTEEIDRAQDELKELKGLARYGICFLGMDGRIVAAGQGMGGVGNAKKVHRTLRRITKQYRLVVALALANLDDGKDGLTTVIVQGPVKSGNDMDDDLAYTAYGIQSQLDLTEGDLHDYL